MACFSLIHSGVSFTICCDCSPTPVSYLSSVFIFISYPFALHSRQSLSPFCTTDSIFCVVSSVLYCSQRFTSCYWVFHSLSYFLFNLSPIPFIFDSCVFISTWFFKVILSCWIGFFFNQYILRILDKYFWSFPKINHFLHNFRRIRS